MSNWNDGISTLFTYSTHNNNNFEKNSTASIKIIKDIQSRSVEIDLEAIASFTCSDVLIEISTYASIFLEQDDKIDRDVVYNETHSLQDMEILSIDNLQPCTTYRLKMSILEEENKHVEIYNENFKTDLGIFDGRNDTLLRLEKNEVILEINTSSSNEDESKDEEHQSVKITWADRCVESYKVNFCRIPLECMHNRIQSSTTKSLDDKVTDKIRKYLKRIIIKSDDN